MIELTGTLKGKVYNQEVVSPDQFAELVGAPKKKPGDGQHVLEICPNLIKTTPEGQMNYPRGILQQGHTSLTIDGDTVNVRYYKQKNQTAPGMFNYTPSHVKFEGLRNAYPNSSYEEFLFMFVSPLCKNSPSASMDPMIQYHDPEAIENAAIASSDRLERLLSVVQKAPDTEIIAKSRGMLVKGMGTNLPEGSKVGMHRAALIQLLVQHPTEFEREWTSDSVEVRGLAREAVQMGGVKQKQIGVRMAWVWGSDDRVITFIAEGADPLTELVSWAISAENHEFAKSALTLAITGQAQRTPELHPSTPPPPADPSTPKSELRLMLEQGIAKGVVWREEDTNRIMYQGPQGIPVETVTFDGPDWLTRLETFCKTPGKQEHKKAIELAVNN